MSLLSTDSYGESSPIRPDFSEPSPSLSESQSEGGNKFKTRPQPPPQPPPRKKRIAVCNEKKQIIDLTQEGSRYHPIDLEEGSRNHHIDLTNDDDDTKRDAIKKTFEKMQCEVVGSSKLNKNEIDEIKRSLRNNKDLCYDHIEFEKRILHLSVALMPILRERLQRRRIRPKKNYAIDVLVITPHKQSSQFIYDVMQNITSTIEQCIMGTIGICTGGKVNTQYNTSIVCATPGTLINLLEQKKIYVDEVAVLVLESANVFFNSESLRQQMQVVTKYFDPNESNNRSIKVIFADVFDTELCSNKNTKDVQKVNNYSRDMTHMLNMNHYVFYSSDRYVDLQRILHYYTKSTANVRILIFFGYKKESKRVYRSLKDKWMGNVQHIDGEKTLMERTSILSKWRRNSMTNVSVLFASDCIAGSIDILSNVIINYSFSSTFSDIKSYIKRLSNCKKDADIYTMVPKHERRGKVSINKQILNDLKHFAQRIKIHCGNDWIQRDCNRNRKRKHSDIL